jgi:putative multiple sugar transport system substrate-binding protein
MSILKPYIDSGKLVVKSGQIGLDVTGTLKWDSATAQSRMDNIISSYYNDENLDAVLVAADCLALGVISSLNSLGYGSADKPFPVITGQDSELTAIKYILEGKQSMTVFLDAKLLSEKMLALVSDLEAGKTITQDTTYNNGAKDVPTLLYDPVLITKDNYQLLVERGFYTEDDLK